ncbi:hypothetical protein ANCCAN_20270, partial [Ancylostoma caninum]
MPGFERTREAAEIFAKLICCANPEWVYYSRQESDNLQILGTACKHAFCWDCINTYSSANTLVLCPTCACPLDVNHPKAATLFNNLAQHINEFKLLLDEYERCLRNEGTAAAATMAQTQMLFQAHDLGGDSDKAARNEAINEFISTQRVPSGDLDNDLDLDSPASDFSEELNITTPPTKNAILTADVADDEIGEKPKPVVEFADCFDEFSDDDITAAPLEDGVITDSVPQFDHPIMTSTQRPVLFLSQAVHARNELFQNETKQAVLNATLLFTLLSDKKMKKLLGICCRKVRARRLWLQIRNIRQETPSQLAQRRSPLRSLVEKYRTHPRQPFVARLPDVYIVCFAREVKRSLTYGEQSLLSKLMTVVEFCDEATTHYVVSADAEGVASVDADLLRAMLQNTRIMSVDWLKECVRLNSTVPHLHYEVSKLRYMENNVVVDSLERCRKSKERMEPGLFHGCVFYLLLKKYKGIGMSR